MKYDMTITFEHGELSIEGCEKPFTTEGLESEIIKALGLGKAKEVAITFN